MKERSSDHPLRHLFGPVPSRRLGRSLGVDLVPFKTCTFDCPFCQLGRTTDKTLSRREYVPVSEVVAEFEAWLQAGGDADAVTLSGSGEPTLHSRFGEVLDAVGRRSAIRRVLLTNGSLLHRADVRRGAASADVVKASLSAWDRASFEAVNRPHPGLDFAKVVDGIRRFRAEFTGELRLEVFVLAGVNNRPESMAKIAALVAGIRADRVELNTIVRPPADPEAQGVSPQVLGTLAGLFDPPAEVIPEFTPGSFRDWSAQEEEILAMLARRPCSARDVAAGFGLHPNEAAKFLGKLERSGECRRETRGDTVYFLVRKK